MAYLDYFTRAERHLDSEELGDYKESISLPSKSTEDIKLQNLYRDCLGPHVTNCFSAPRDAVYLSQQKDRVVAADNLTHVFLNSYYTVPDIFQSLSPRLETETKLSLPEFLSRVTTNPIDSRSETKNTLGTNKVTYLLGDVGVGKSTLISRLLMEFADTYPVDDEGYTIVPVLYDFETQHKDGEKLKNIDESFWADLYHLICLTIRDDSDLATQAMLDNSILINPSLPGGGVHPEIIHHMRQIIHHLALRKIRLFFVFDNLDRYHFHYTEYSFFENYAQQQFESVKANILTLVTMFDRKHLWTSGLCVLFVCRRYLYDYLVSNFDDVAPRDNHFAIFQLSRPTVKDVVASRLDLFDKAVKVVAPTIKTVESTMYRDFLRNLKRVLTVEDTASHCQKSETPALEALASIGHNGYRSLVKFLASLPLRYKDADAIKRLLVDQSHLLLLLYIANNHQRYTQDQSHFPNLFLCDALVSPNREFPQAHEPHEHTYWLKYLILKYIAVREDEKDYCTGADIIDFFAGQDGYDEHLVRLVLGSLCTTREFSCVEIEYSHAAVTADCRLTLTDRGRYLTRHDHKLFGNSHPIDFCFQFSYLQLMIDDKLLAVPKSFFAKFPPNSRYGYFYLPDDKYGEVARHAILLKIEAVFYFLRTLEGCWDFELKRKASLFDKLSAKKVTPDFRRINRAMLDTTLRLLGVASNEYSRFEALETMLKYDDSFVDFYSNIPQPSCIVQK